MDHPYEALFDRMVALSRDARSLAGIVQNDVPIPQEDLDKCWRNVVRRAAALIVHAMAEADADYALIGCRLGKSAEDVKAMLASYIECTTDDFREVSDLTRAMDCRIGLSIKQLEFPKPHADEQPAPKTPGEGRA